MRSGLGAAASGYARLVQTCVSARGPAPPDEVWERYADLDRWPRWAPQISGVDAPSRRLAPGLEGTVRALGLLHLRFTVLAVDPAAGTWSWRVRLGPLELELEHGVEPVERPSGTTGASTSGDGARTRTWLRTRGPAAVVVGYTPLAFVALHALVADAG